MGLILVIEDDPTQRLLTSSVLRSAGYEVVEAEDGIRGLDLARKTRPALIVCDVMMPGLNGYELVASLKQDEVLCATPVILLTAMTERVHMRMGMTAGADDYLSKPFRAVELRQSVAALLAKHEAQRAQYVRVFEQQMDVALQDQKSDLSLRYEKRLLWELNERWNERADTNSEVRFDHATVLLVDLFSAIAHRYSVGQRAQATRRAYQAASDTLYLFGARRLVVSGNDLLAIFVDEDGATDTSSGLSAVRSAFGLLKMVKAVFQSTDPDQTGTAAGISGTPPVAIALSQGAVSLIQVKDPLHGGEGLTFACGEAVDAAKSMGEHARASGWQVCCAQALRGGLDEWVVAGDAAVVGCRPGQDAFQAVELSSLAETQQT